MPGKVTFEIKGAKELEATLKELGPKVAVRIGDKALRVGAGVIVKEAKRLAPRRTGQLRKSIVAVKGRDARPEQRTVVVGFKKPGRRYAHLVEFGTSKAAAKPFLRPALDTKAKEALDKIAEILADGILRQDWRKAIGIIAAGEELDFGNGE